LLHTATVPDHGTYFIEKPFQNWTKETADLLGSVHLNVDYTAPIEELRQKLKEIVKSTPLWDGKVVVLQVVEAQPTTIQLRALVSARNSGQAWDLRCYVREKLIEFLQQKYPHALPRQRVDLEAQSNAADRNAIFDDERADANHVTEAHNGGPSPHRPLSPAQPRREPGPSRP
jgi:hypothetical protein